MNAPVHRDFALSATRLSYRLAGHPDGSQPARHHAPPVAFRLAGRVTVSRGRNPIGQQQRQWASGPVALTCILQRYLPYQNAFMAIRNERRGGTNDVARACILTTALDAAGIMGWSPVHGL